MSNFEIEWMAHDFADEHWHGFFWLSVRPEPFMFPNGGGAHGMLVAHYRVAAEPTVEASYWQLSKRGKDLMRYVDDAVDALDGKPLKKLRTWEATSEAEPFVYPRRPPPEVMPLLRALAVQMKNDDAGVSVWLLPFGRALLRRVALLESITKNDP